MSSLSTIESDIVRWGDAREITIHKTEQERQLKIRGQALKLNEEVGELCAAIVRQNQDDFQDAIGDIFVVLCMLTTLNNTNMTTCAKLALKTIEPRKGRLDEMGVWIKE